MTRRSPTPSPDADFAARFAEAAARANEREQHARRNEGLWLSHHHPEEWDRCLVIRGRRVCRRCFVLYPLAFSIALLTLAGGSPWPPELDPWFIWGLSIPATVEFVGEQLGRFRYSARRQVAVTAVVAVAYGRGLGLELQDSWHWLFWGPILLFGTAWFTAAMVGRRRRGR